MVLTSLRTFLLVCRSFGANPHKAEASQGVVDGQMQSAAAAAADQACMLGGITMM
jgi:hypothetical protein